MNVQTNIGREFLNLVIKHFPKNHRYSKILVTAPANSNKSKGCHLCLTEKLGKSCLAKSQTDRLFLCMSDDRHKA